MVSGRLILALTALGVLHAGTAFSQSDANRVELGGQVVSVRSGQFDTTDTGLGARVAWTPSAIFGFEAELNLFPQDFPDGQPFSRGRVEGLFGATVGVPLGRIKPFVRVRPGFVVVQEAPGPLACILIFPPPLSCTLAAGRTLAAVDVGGGVAFDITDRTFVRVDLGDRLLRYPGPVFDANRVVRDRAFFVNEFRLAAGAGIRF